MLNDSAETVGAANSVPLALHSTNQSGFQQAYQLASCFDIEPGNAVTAAFLSLLFQQTGARDSLVKLRDWLNTYVSSFIKKPLREQADQVEKVLAVAAYLYTSYQTRQKTFNQSQLFEYINYAQKQSWFDDTFIAFYCGFLKDEVDTCREVDNFFKSNLDIFLSKKNIPAICQALIVLSEKASDVDRQRCHQVIRQRMENSALPLRDSAWVLWSMHTAVDVSNQQAAQELANVIHTRLQEYMSMLVRESQVFSLLALMLNDMGQADLRRYVTSISANNTSSLVKLTFHEGVVNLSKADSLGNTDMDRLSVADVSLALIALSATGWHRLIGVPQAQENHLRSSLRKAQELTEGAVIISKGELSVANILAIILEMILGVVIFSYFLDVKLNFSFDVSQVSLPDSLRDIDLSILLVAGWLDHLAAQIKALRSGKSAIEGMLQLPILRHFGIGKKL